MASNNRPIYFVSLKVDSEKEAEFNDWYSGYLESLEPPASDFTSIRRFVQRDADGEPVYVTIYEFADEESIESTLEVFERPERQQSRKEWQAWESSHLYDVTAGVFLQVYPQRNEA